MFFVKKVEKLSDENNKIILTNILKKNRVVLAFNPLQTYIRVISKVHVDKKETHAVLAPGEVWLTNADEESYGESFKLLEIEEVCKELCLKEIKFYDMNKNEKSYFPEFPLYSDDNTYLGYYRTYSRKLAYCVKFMPKRKIFKIFCKQQYIFLAKVTTEGEFEIFSLLNKTDNKIIPFFTDSSNLNNFLNSSRWKEVKDKENWKPVFCNLEKIIKTKVEVNDKKSDTLICNPITKTIVKDSLSSSVYLNKDIILFIKRNYRSSNIK